MFGCNRVLASRYNSLQLNDLLLIVLVLRLRYGAAANQWRRVRELTSFTDRIGLVGRARVREPNIGRCDPVGVLQLLVARLLRRA